MNQQDLHFEKLSVMYQFANINQTHFSQSILRIQFQEAELHWHPVASFHHAMGSPHGAVAFKLLDDAAYFAAQSTEMEFALLTASFQVHFLRPLPDRPLLAVGKLKQKSRNLWISESSLFDDRKKELAFGMGSFMKSSMELRSVKGYGI